MKFSGFVIGAFFALVLSKWIPHAIEIIGSATNFPGCVAAIGIALSSLWIVALGRLIAFEKLEDLSDDQKDIIVGHGRRYRALILSSIALNTIILILVLLITAFNAILLVSDGIDLRYFLLPAAGFWTFGFWQSVRLLRSIEESRISIARTQSAEKSRKAYLTKMRADARQNPIDHADSHLRRYTT